MVIPRPRIPGASVCAVVALFDTIESGEIGVIEVELDRSHVLLEVRDRARARNQQLPVSTVSLPFSSDTIEGKADRLPGAAVPTLIVGGLMSCAGNATPRAG
jgi:hypothetical protein